MKYGIDIGHNCPPDTGAKGIRFEDNLTLDVGNRVIAKLKALGHEVVECKPGKVDAVRESFSKRCTTANANKVDVYVSIHFNCFNTQANGTEIFTIGESGRKIAKLVLDEIIKLGFFNRGIKNGSHIFVLRNINMPGIVIEGCFLDSQKDMRLFDSEAMANAIVKGLTGKLPIELVHVVADEEQNKDTTILRLKKSLNRLKITGINGKPLVEDNTNDTETKSAIEKFQRIAGFQVNGIADDTTWNGINLILAKRIIRPNHAGGPIVRYLQHRLGLDVDGVYGLETEEAIKKFQRQNALLVDGIIGPISWLKLIG